MSGRQTARSEHLGRRVGMEITAAEWNQRYPVGTAVRYHPIIDEKDFITSRTRSEAWELGHGAAVVKIEGRAGGVALEAIDVVAAEPDFQI